MFKPMLASEADLENLRLPVFASPKLDGIRCIVHPEAGVVSRNIKPIRNYHIRRALEQFAEIGSDGELITYTEGVMDGYDTVNSKVMSAAGSPDFVYHVFDNIRHADLPYRARMSYLEDNGPCRVVEQTLIEDMQSLEAYEEAQLELGYEGVMLRDPNSFYKFGRSTTREGWLLKLKRFQDCEARVIGWDEQYHNANEARIDALGRTERSSHQANLFGKDTLGSLVCVLTGGDEASPVVEFSVGTGFDDGTRARLWGERNNLIGRIVRVKYQGFGANGRPRFPTFVGFRDEADL